jgi:hypothetical protein
MFVVTLSHHFVVKSQSLSFGQPGVVSHTTYITLDINYNACNNYYIDVGMFIAPCVRSIPHLSELQHKYKNVTFLGVSDESAAKVEPFVRKMGDKVS